MIVEERIYTAQVGRAREWIEDYGARGLPVQQRHLGRLIGFFQSEIGQLNLIVHLWAYDSLADREQRRARMAQDPAWHEYLRDAPKVLLAQESRILNPVAFSPLK